MASSSVGLLPGRFSVPDLAALAVLLGVATFGCASTRDFLVGSLPGGSKSSTYYVGAESLPLFREPGRGLLAKLPRNEKVVRSRVEKGWAFVRVAGTGLEGWVDNAGLVWRAEAAVESQPISTTRAEVDAPTAPPVPDEPAEPPAPAQSDQTPEQPGRAPVPPSVFDPY